MSIFGQNASSLGSTSGNRHSIELKAGRMNLVDSDQGGVKKKMVHPDQRKGLLYIYSADDGLTHFCWKDRTTGTLEDDLIIFPDDCEFKKVEQSKDGRVYLLRFKSSNRKLFFWLQEPNSDKDDDNCRRVNELLNNPPSSGGSGGGNGGTRGEGSDLQYMLNNMSQQQLMQLFGGVGQMGGLSSLLGSINRTGGSRTSTTTPATAARSTTATAGAAAVTTTPANSTQPATPRAPKKDTNSGETTESSPPATVPNPESSRVLLSELQNYLAGINTGASGSRQNVDLSTSLTSDSINSVLSDPERLEALQAHLPNIDEEGKPMDPNAVKQQLKDTLASPQFQQALSMFSNALQSGQLGPVVSQFKLSDAAVAAANTGDLEQFVKALEKTSIKDPSAKEDEAMEEDKKDEPKE